MIKKRVFAWMVILASCGGNAPAEQKTTETTTTTPPAATVQEPQVQPYFSGNGNEPGWSLTMDANVKGTFPVVLTYNYGEETLKGELTKEGLVAQGKNNVASGEAKFSGTLSGNSKTETVSVSIVSEECHDDADKKHSHRCSVTVAGKTLKGCGDYID